MKRQQDDDSQILIGCLPFVIVGFLIMFIWGFYLGDSSAKNAAVKAGVAEYVADKDGRSQFRFIPLAEKIPNE